MLTLNHLVNMFYIGYSELRFVLQVFQLTCAPTLQPFKNL